jgi:hypothetical protein
VRAGRPRERIGDRCSATCDESGRPCPRWRHAGAEALPASRFHLARIPRRGRVASAPASSGAAEAETGQLVPGPTAHPAGSAATTFGPRAGDGDADASYLRLTRDRPPVSSRRCAHFPPGRRRGFAPLARGPWMSRRTSTRSAAPLRGPPRVARPPAPGPRGRRRSRPRASGGHDRLGSRLVEARRPPRSARIPDQGLLDARADARPLRRRSTAARGGRDPHADRVSTGTVAGEFRPPRLARARGTDTPAGRRGADRRARSTRRIEPWRPAPTCSLGRGRPPTARRIPVPDAASAAAAALWIAIPGGRRGLRARMKRRPAAGRGAPPAAPRRRCADQLRRSWLAAMEGRLDVAGAPGSSCCGYGAWRWSGLRPSITVGAGGGGAHASAATRRRRDLLARVEALAPGGAGTAGRARRFPGAEIERLRAPCTANSRPRLRPEGVGGWPGARRQSPRGGGAAAMNVRAPVGPAAARRAGRSLLWAVPGPQGPASLVADRTTTSIAGTARSRAPGADCSAPFECGPALHARGGRAAARGPAGPAAAAMSTRPAHEHPVRLWTSLWQHDVRGPLREVEGGERDVNGVRAGDAVGLTLFGFPPQQNPLESR